MKKILIDLDGVLNNYGNQPYDENFIPGIKSGVKKFLIKLNKSAELYLFTSRNLKLATKWLIDNNIDKYFKDVTNIKIPAYLYIDDRCVCFQGNYNDTLKQIDNFCTYWKK